MKLRRSSPVWLPIALAAGVAAAVIWPEGALWAGVTAAAFVSMLLAFVAIVGVVMSVVFGDRW